MLLRAAALLICICWLPGHAASEVRSILEDEAASVNKESDNYWVLAAALKRFIDNEGKGQLPIEVCLPKELSYLQRRAALLHCVTHKFCQQGCWCDQVLLGVKASQLAPALQSWHGDFACSGALQSM